MNYDSYKEQAVYACDDIINNCNRMTTGNFMHNVAAVKMFAETIKKCVEHLYEKLWVLESRQLPEPMHAPNGVLFDMSEHVIVKDVWGKKWIAQYDYRYKRWWGEEKVVVDVVSWMKIPD